MALLYNSTACLAKHYPSLRALLRAFEESGLRRIELGHSPPLQDFPLPGGLREFSGTSFLLHNYFPPPAVPFVLNLASADEAVLRRSREFCEHAIRLSAELRAPSYSVHCGFLAEFLPASLGQQLKFGAITPYEDGYRIFAESIAQLLAVGDRAGVRLLVEPNVVAPVNLLEGANRLLLLAEPREFTRLLADFRGSRLGVLLDLGHLRVTARTLGFDWREFVAAVAPAVGAFHLHDNDGLSDQHRPVDAGSYALEVLRRPEFAALPVVIEAQFPDLAALASHNSWLDSRLAEPLICLP